MTSTGLPVGGDPQLPAYPTSTSAEPMVLHDRYSSESYLRRFLPSDGGQNESNAPAYSDERRNWAAEQPPMYTPFDEHAKVLSLCGSIINIVDADGLDRPRYQLKQQLSTSGKLGRLQIRRLLPSESRRLSAMSGSASVEFDADTMLYEVENIGSLHVLQRPSIRIRGRKAGTLLGHIELKPAGRDGFDFHHCTQPAAKHWSREENMRKMNKWGYKADQEWEKKLLFACRSAGRKGNREWKQNDDLVDDNVTVANEIDGSLVLQKQVSERMRDTLVTCWAASKWATGKLNDDSSLNIRLSRWKTVG